MTRTQQYALRTYALALVAIVAAAQFGELRSDSVMRFIAALLPGVFA